MLLRLQERFSQPTLADAYSPAVRTSSLQLRAFDLY